MEAYGLMECSVPRRPARESTGVGGSPGVGEGIKLTIMKDPWPEMDICVGGVDKGSALARLLRHPAVRTHLGAERIDASTHVARTSGRARDRAANNK